jgi:RNA polymerase primary sigma factor
MPRTKSGRGRSVDAPARSARETVATRTLLRAAQRGDLRARDELTQAHLGLVRAVAARYRDLGLPLEDLVQEGALGLLEAIAAYEPRRGASFETYARLRIRRAIRNALTDHGRLIRIPKYVIERRRALDRAESRLLASGRRPTALDLAAATGLTVDAILEARAATPPPLSLDAPGLPDGSSLEAVVRDRTAQDPEQEALARDRREQVAAALQSLDERQCQIVMRHWGLGGGDATSLAELAAELHLSPRRTQTIASEALHELRRTLAAPPAAGCLSRR